MGRCEDKRKSFIYKSVTVPGTKKVLYNSHIIRKINKGVHVKVAAEMIPEESVGFKALRGTSCAKALWQEEAWAVPATGRSSGGFGANSEEVAVRPEAAGADHNSAHEALNAMVGSWHLWNLS